MSEKIEKGREVYVSMQDSNIYLVMLPPLTEEEKVGFPAPPYAGVDLDEPLFKNGSQMVTLQEYKKSGQWKKNLEIFIANVMRHLPDAMVDQALHDIHPESIFGYGAAVISEVEPSSQYI